MPHGDYVNITKSAALLTSGDENARHDLAEPKDAKRAKKIEAISRAQLLNASSQAPLVILSPSGTLRVNSAKNLVLYVGVTLFHGTMAPVRRKERWNLGAGGRDSSLRSE